VDRVKQAFSIELVDSLKHIYGGRLPSISKIARDFSLKSPHLPHISSETIRKWIRGESLPHISRMQVLIDWLGPQMAIPFEQPVMALQFAKKRDAEAISQNGNGHSNLAPIESHPIHDQLVNIIDQLNEKECQSILAIAKLLAEKHSVENETSTLIHNGHETKET
jgi:hypothetical protein